MDLIALYFKSERQQQPIGDIIIKEIRLYYMMVLGPTMGWLKIVQVLCFNFDGVSDENKEYIYKSSFRASQLFNQKRI